MIQKLKSFLGIKEYLIKIKWDNGKKEFVAMKACSPMQAINKVAETKDVVNKAKMTILNHRKSIIEVRPYRVESFGIAVRKEKEFIEKANTELNNVVHHLKYGDYEQAEELTRKIAFSIPENYKDGFWLSAVFTVIRTVILALAEDVVSAKRENIDMFAVANILENKQFTLDDFINSRADNSLAKKTYKPIFLMGFETRNRVIGEAIISIKLKLQDGE